MPGAYTAYDGSCLLMAVRVWQDAASDSRHIDGKSKGDFNGWIL